MFINSGFNNFSLSFLYSAICMGFPCGSAAKKSACNVGDQSSIPGLRRSPGEGKGYPLQYSGLENSGLQRVGHNQATSTFSFFHLSDTVEFAFYLKHYCRKHCLVCLYCSDELISLFLQKEETLPLTSYSFVILSTE